MRWRALSIQQNCVFVYLNPKGFSVAVTFSGDYTVLFTSFSGSHKRLPNLINASWLWRISRLSRLIKVTEWKIKGSWTAIQITTLSNSVCKLGHMTSIVWKSLFLKHWKNRLFSKTVKNSKKAEHSFLDACNTHCLNQSALITHIKKCCHFCVKIFNCFLAVWSHMTTFASLKNTKLTETTHICLWQVSSF